MATTTAELMSVFQAGHANALLVITMAVMEVHAMPTAHTNVLQDTWTEEMEMGVLTTVEITLATTGEVTPLDVFLMANASRATI